MTWWRGGVASYVNSSWTHFDVERGRLKCYDTRPVTKIFWVFFLNLVNRSPNPTPLHPRPLITHTQMQSLQRQSDRTATLRIRVRIVEHVVCHTNSGCWGKFSKLTPPPSLPITVMGSEAYRTNSATIIHMWTFGELCYSPPSEGSKGRWSSVGHHLFFCLVFF